MKTKKDADGMVTKKMFNKGIDGLAILINKSFEGVESRMAKQEDLLALSARVTGLEKDMKGMHGNFDMVFQQLKDIRNEIKEADTRADVVDLQVRVSKLEKKVAIQPRQK